MFYRGFEVLKEVVWVIFDEIYYMKDRERGVVWEESIIFFFFQIKMVFLLVTMLNVIEFVEWICNIYKQFCYVVYIDFRLILLQYYVFSVGGSGLYLVVDENEQFREDNFVKFQDSFVKFDSGMKVVVVKVSGRIVKVGSGFKGGLDIYKIVKVYFSLDCQLVLLLVIFQL